MGKKWCTILSVWLVILSLSLVSQAVVVLREELNQRDQWMDWNLSSRVNQVAAALVKPKEAPLVGLVVLANLDVVQQNARAGKPMKLGNVEYNRGLYCHAVSDIVVNLPGPAKTFTAVVGVDNNEATAGGQGSVIFTVQVAGTDVFRSEVLRGGQAGVPVQVDLAGARQFNLRISDGGDSIDCDQSDWADAKVVLADGKELWLGELPIILAPELRIRPRELGVPAFSFTYDGRSSDEFLSKWKFTQSQKKLDTNRTQVTQTYSDPQTHLVVKLVSVVYADYPVVEWTMYFQNTGEKDTPMLESIQPLDMRLQRKANQSEFVLHGNRGDSNGPASYEPFQQVLSPSSTTRFAPNEGKATSGAFPYYHLQTPGGGVTIVIGWPAQWAATFTRGDKGGLRVTAGQELTHLYLKPGEEIRTPLMALLFWNGDDLDHPRNLWRSWMVNHNLPRTADGKLAPTQLCGNNQQQIGFTAVTEQNQKDFIRLFVERGLKLDYWWLDTGWYINNGHWWLSGTWEIEKSRFPNGIRPVSDYAHSQGMKFILWFEPERVGDMNSWLGKNHPEWIIPWMWGGGLLDLGNPEAQQWLTNYIDKFITEQGIDVYRQDFNMAPIDCWRVKDTPDRQGIAENFHTQGYLKFWDTLRQRHPMLRIDSCASGGRRNDLEAMRRAVPLHRTDYNFEPTSQQCHHYGLSQWIPYHGTGFMVGKSVIEPPDCPMVPIPDEIVPYYFRSAMSPSLTVGLDLRDKNLDYDLARRLFDQFRLVTPCYLGDFYPLTDYTLSNEVWLAWQYDLPEQGRGVLQAFRRPDNTEESQTYKLRGLNPNANYIVTDLDVNQPQKRTGRELMESGIEVTAKEKPAAQVITYELVK